MLSGASINRFYQFVFFAIDFKTRKQVHTQSRSSYSIVCHLNAPNGNWLLLIHINFMRIHQNFSVFRVFFSQYFKIFFSISITPAKLNQFNLAGGGPNCFFIHQMAKNQSHKSYLSLLCFGIYDCYDHCHLINYKHMHFSVTY